MRLFAGICLVFLAGCASTPEELSSADSAVLAGSSIRIPGTEALPPGVDADASYAKSRDLYVLKVVARLTPDEQWVLDRANTIADPRPDNRITVEELARLAGPDYIVALSPAQRNALRDVWRKMKAPAKVRIALPAGAELAPTDRSSFVVVRPHGNAIVRPAERTVFQISEASVVHAGVAQQSQYSFDSDGDPNTVALVDLDAALASPGFTAAEKLDLGRLRAAFVAKASAEADAAAQATPRTMTAGELRIPGELTREGDVRISEGTLLLRRHGWIEGARSSEYHSISLREYVSTSFAIDVMDGRGQYLIPLEADGEHEIRDGGAPGAQVRVEPGVETLAEAWADGEPLARYVLAGHPKMARGFDHTMDLSEYLGYRIVVNGAERPRMFTGHQDHAGRVLAIQYGGGYTSSYPVTPEERRTCFSDALPEVIPGGYRVDLGGTSALIELYAPPDPVTMPGEGGMVITLDRQVGELAPGVPHSMSAAGAGRRIWTEGARFEVSGTTLTAIVEGVPRTLPLDATTRVAW